MGAPKNGKAVRSAPRLVHALRIFLRPHNRGPAFAAVILIAAICGLAFAWNRWGKLATHTDDFIVTPERIHVTPPPPWIHGDVKAEVIRTAGLTRRNLRDRDLVKHVASAFALHAWVAKVNRVQKRYPAQVDVEVEYRKPVASVEITNRGQPGLLFVDAESVLLPSSDFAQNQAKDFLRIAAGTSTPAGLYGSAWGDPRIAGAARLAAAWDKRFQPLSLYRIVPTELPSGELIYELRTVGETRILWGHAPGQETATEPTPEQKIQALENYVNDKGPLDRENGERLIDVCKLASTIPKTAAVRKASTTR